MNRGSEQSGFTVLEVIIVITFLIIAGSVFLVQKRDIEQAGRDKQRKTSINSMYYAIEEVYYPLHQSYPKTVDSKVLPGVDPELFKDPNNSSIGDQNSDYVYQPTDCNGTNDCKGYTLKSHLEKESDFVRSSKN
jgi:type II secretory pathway pseudopilin PulG